MMLSYVSGFQNLQKTKKHYFTLSKKKVMELWSLLALNGLCLSSEEAENHPPLTRTQASILNSRRGHNEDTSSTSLKYYIQDITVNNYHLISLKIIMLVFIT